jgi:uncharacterized protein YecE (DUF72 family)
LYYIFLQGIYFPDLILIIIPFCLAKVTVLRNEYNHQNRTFSYLLLSFRLIPVNKYKSRNHLLQKVILLMKFGQITDIGHVNFSRPKIQINESISVEAKVVRNKLTFYSGTTSWNNKEWLDTIYPAGTKNTNMLFAYGRQFNSIELNSTHYGIPDASRIEKWIQQVPVDFRFSPKFPQTISHRQDLGINSGQLQIFLELLLLFGDKLGMPFIQFPTQMTTRQVQRIFDFLHAVGAKIPIAIELRDPGFYDSTVKNELLEAFTEFNACWVCTDTAGMRQIVHSMITSKDFFVRMVGCGDWKTDKLRLDNWLQHIGDLQKVGVQNVYFYLHDPDHYTHANMALYLYRNIQDNQIINTRGPELLSTAIQQKLF